jgi:S-adenosylmethionine hydrolase
LTRPIFLLTDFGLRDHYVGQVRGVIASIAPDAPLHDLTHELEPFAIDEGAWLLETCLEALPAEALVMAVVDPGEGTARQPLAVRAGSRLLVGPDNGLLSPAAAAGLRATLEQPSEVRVIEAGLEARVLGNETYRRARVSATFHGRDIFAPAAAHLASGVALEALGPRSEGAILLPRFGGRARGAGLEGYVIHVDRYGNAITTIREDQIPGPFVVEAGGRCIESHVRSFAEGRDEVFTHVDSSGFLAIAAREQSAAKMLGIGRGTPVLVRRL